VGAGERELSEMKATHRIPALFFTLLSKFYEAKLFFLRKNYSTG